MPTLIRSENNGRSKSESGVLNQKDQCLPVGDEVLARGNNSDDICNDVECGEETAKLCLFPVKLHCI